MDYVEFIMHGVNDWAENRQSEGVVLLASMFIGMCDDAFLVHDMNALEGRRS